MSNTRPFPTGWVLLFLGGLSVCIQYVTVEKFSVFPPGVSHVTWGTFIRSVEAQITFSALDGLLVALFLVGSAFVLYQEMRFRVLSDFLQDCFASQRKTLGLLIGCLLVGVRFYLARGEVSWAADASHHIYTAWLVAQAIADGQMPIWTFYLGTGSPHLQNYGFAFFCLVGLVQLVLDDFFLSLKLTMAAAAVLSGIGMYYLAASLCRSRRAGFIAGLGYGLCFWHAQHVLIMGRFAVSLFYALLPWAFYGIERVIDSPYKMRAALLGGVSIALLNCTHPGYGVYAMMLLGCYSVVRLWSCWRHPELGAIVRAGVVLFVLGVAFSSYMSVGMYLERVYTKMYDSFLNLSVVADPTWRHLLGWSNYRFWLIPPDPFHWYGGYLGVSVCALALAGGVVLLRQRDRRMAACWVCLMLTAWVVFAYRWPPVSTLPLLHDFNASRYVLFLSFFLALAAGIGAHVLCNTFLNGAAPRSRTQKPHPEAAPRSRTQKPHPEAAPRSRTQKPHPEAAPRSRTQKPHPEAAPRSRTQKPHPEAAPRSRTQKPHPEAAPSRLYTLLLLVVWIDLFSTTFIHPYYPKPYTPTGWPPEIFAEVRKAATPFMERDELPNYRAQWIGEGVYPAKRRASMLYYGAVPIAGTDHPGELRTAVDFIEPFTDWAHSLLPQMESVEQFEAHPHRDLLMAGFHLLNTRYVLATSNQRGSGFTTELGDYSPLVVSGRLADYREKTVDLTDVAERFGDDLDDAVARVLWIILATGLHAPPDEGVRSCDRILVRDRAENALDLGTEPTAQVLSHRVFNQQVQMKVAVSARCYVRLAYAYFPYLRVTVDGVPVQPMETAGRFMALPLEAGEHDIVIEARLSPLRKSLVALSGVLLVGALVLVFREHRSAKGSREA